MAARSAVRTGWLTGAVMLKMADPRWMRSVREATEARNTSGSGHVRVLTEEVVLGCPHVLEPEFLGPDRELEVVEEATLLVSRSGLGHLVWDEDLREVPELHTYPLLGVSTCSDL